MDTTTDATIEATDAPAPETTAAPPAPADAPTEDAATTPAAPQTIEAALEAYKEGTLTRAGEGEAVEEEAAPEADAGQARDEQGRFAATEEGEEEDPAPEGEAAEGDGGEEEAPAPVLRLMSRLEGEDPIEVNLSEEQLEALGIDREALERTNNGVMRRQQWLSEKAALQKQRAEVQAEREDFYQRLEDSDAAAELIAKNTRPDVQERLLETLVAQVPPETFERIVDQVLEFHRDPRARELAQAKQLLNRQEQEQPTPAEQPKPEVTPEVMTRSQRIVDRVVNLAGEAMPEDQFNAYYQDAIQGLVAYSELHQLDDWSPDDAVAALESLGVLRKHGLSLPGGSASPTSNGSSRTARAGGDQPGAGQEDETDFQTRVSRRRSASAVAPGGQGAAQGSVATPIEGERVEDRIAAYRKARGL